VYLSGRTYTVLIARALSNFSAWHFADRKYFAAFATFLNISFAPPHPLAPSSSMATKACKRLFYNESRRRISSDVLCILKSNYQKLCFQACLAGSVSSIPLTNFMTCSTFPMSWLAVSFLHISDARSASLKTIASVVTMLP
jgi:hypothetical protein